MKRTSLLRRWTSLPSPSAVVSSVKTAAIDLTANQHGKPRKRGRALGPSAFTLTASWPHIIYDFEDDQGYVDLSSPQFPLLAFRTTFTNPLMRELAVVDEYFNADYFHHYSHLQCRCRAPGSDGGRLDDPPGAGGTCGDVRCSGAARYPPASAGGERNVASSRRRLLRGVRATSARRW